MYKAEEFRFYRCLKFEESFYGKSVSELFNGNLRNSTGRYSTLFNGQKVSYWADSIKTAKAEIRKYGANKDIISFFAYDDASSTIPILGNEERLIIIDARESDVQRVVDKLQEKEKPTDAEMKMWYEVLAQQPDCMVYNSRERKGGQNFIFLEKGFKKLALREIKLYLGERKSRPSAKVSCAVSSDYSPILENYGCYFTRIARVGYDKNYESTEEYRNRNDYYQAGLSRLKNAYGTMGVID